MTIAWQLTRACVEPVGATETGAVIDTLKHDVERRNKDLKELTFKHQNVTQDRDDMQKTLLQLHQEVQHAPAP